MKNINNIKLKKNSSIKQALKIISKGKMQIALVDDGNKLIGTLTDGDIRRGLLRGLNLNKLFRLLFTEDQWYLRLVIRKKIY